MLVYLHSFSFCWLPNLRNRAKFRENSNIWQAKVIYLGVNWKRICDFLLVIHSKFGVSPTVFGILAFKARKWLVFPTPPLFDATARRSLLEFLSETYPTKTWRMGLSRIVKILQSRLQPFLTDPPVWRTDRQTGRAIAYSALSIYAICCRALKKPENVRESVCSKQQERELSTNPRRILH